MTPTIRRLKGLYDRQDYGAGDRQVAWILRDVVSRTAREAGLIGRVTPHTLRHTAAVHLIRGGASVRHVQLFLGHATPQTTAHYTQLVLDDLKAAWAQAHPRARMKIAGP